VKSDVTQGASSLAELMREREAIIADIEAIDRVLALLQAPKVLENSLG